MSHLGRSATGHLLKTTTGHLGFCKSCYASIYYPEFITLTYNMITADSGYCFYPIEGDDETSARFISNEFVSPLLFKLYGASTIIISPGVFQTDYNYRIWDAETETYKNGCEGYLDWHEQPCESSGCTDCTDCDEIDDCLWREDIDANIRLRRNIAAGCVTSASMYTYINRILDSGQSQYKGGLLAIGKGATSPADVQADDWYKGYYTNVYAYDGPNEDKRGYRWTQFDSWDVLGATLS